jgi:hypothetical protein
MRVPDLNWPADLFTDVPVASARLFEPAESTPLFRAAEPTVDHHRAPAWHEADLVSA